MSLWTELRRRNVFRVGAAYAVVGWLLVEVSDTIFPRLQLPEWSVTLVIALLIVGFPLALFFAWAFELTPEGLKREREVDRDQSIAPQTGRKLDFIIIGVLALAVTFFAVDKFMLEPAREAEQQREQAERLAAAVTEAREAASSEESAQAPPDHSIAVLAFDDMSPDKDQEYLSDGIAEELLNLLARIPELRVISRSSSFFYKGKDVRLEQIAEELDVAHILEGSVRKAGEQVRITAQLIDARSDSHVWSESYDRTLDDIFAMQDEIAAEVVDQLEVTLLGDVPVVSETDPEAYERYLQAKHLGGMHTAEAFEESSALYRKALEIDPDYAHAMVGLATNYTNRVQSGLLSTEEGYPRVRELAEQALAARPDHARAHSILGWIAMFFESDLAAAARHHERALALEPSDVSVLGNAAVELVFLGRLEQAIAVMEVIRVRDPLNATYHYNLGAFYGLASRWDEAIASWESALRLSPGYRGAHADIGDALLAKGEPEAARQAFEREPFEAPRLHGLAKAAYDLDDMEAFRARRDELIERWGGRFPEEIAQLQAHVGNADTAFEWLDRAVEQNRAGLEFLEPVYEPLHDDPRWRDFLERTDKLPEQLDAIEFEVSLPGETRS